MSKKLYLLISFVLLLSLSSAGYSDIKVDFDAVDDANAGGSSTEAGWTSFTLNDSGSEVNGIIIDIDTITANSARRLDPNSDYSIPNLGDAVSEEQIHRDFIYGLGENPLYITLWGLGADQKCDIHIWAFDDSSDTQRIANWTANGAELLTTDFTGGDYFLWPVPGYHDSYDFNGIGYADEVGRIVLTCTQDANSSEGTPFAFANALEVITYGTPNSISKAHRPVPFDGTEDVPIDTTLIWIPGDSAASHNVYIGTDPCSLVFQGNVGVSSFTPSAFLAMDTVYYWRVDELPGPVQGDVWSFSTAGSYVVDDFEAYGTGGVAIRDYWVDYWHDNSSNAEVYIEQDAPVLDEKSMRYVFENSFGSGDSTATFDLTQAGVEIDTNFVGMNVQALSIWFYGQEANPVTEQMYLKLTDGSAESARVDYDGDMNDITAEQWQEWNIPIQDIADANGSLDLTDIVEITIGFAEGVQVDGTVFFDDIRLYPTRCVLVKRSDELARADFAPINNEDCAVDNLELGIMADDWLARDRVTGTKNPNDVNLVIYYPMDEGDGNRIYPDAAGRLNDPCLWKGIFYVFDDGTGPRTTVAWSTDHAPGIGGSHCLYFDGGLGTRVQCGTDGQAALGIGPDGVRTMTVSLWIKCLGQREGYLGTKALGLIGKRGGWSEETVIWFMGLTETGASAFLASRTGTTYTDGGFLPFEGQWVHVAATYPHPAEDPNWDEHSKIYLNGAEIMDANDFHYTFGDDPNIYLSIGNTMDVNAWTGSPEGFWGYIDEVRIYDRVLEPNEIAYLADPTPDDGVLQIPIGSAAELYEQEPEGQRYINFRDFAYMADVWLNKEYWP